MKHPTRFVVKNYIAGTFLVCRVRLNGTHGGADSPDTILYQSDWDFPGLARMLGYSKETSNDLPTKEVYDFIDSKCGEVLTDEFGQFDELWPCK